MLVKTNSSHLKINGWKLEDEVSFRGGLFSGAMSVSFRECMLVKMGCIFHIETTSRCVIAPICSLFLKARKHFTSLPLPPSKKCKDTSWTHIIFGKVPPIQ